MISALGPKTTRRANHPKPVQPSREKYFCFSEMKIRLLILPSHPARGALRTSRTRGGMRWTRMLRLTSAADAYGEIVWSRHRDAGVKFVRSKRFSLMTVARKPVHRGGHAISRKTIAQGRPDALRFTCMLVCAFPVHIAHETAGAARTRLSLRPLSEGRLRPLSFEGEWSDKTRAQCAAGTRRRVPGEREDASRECGGTFAYFSSPSRARRSMRIAGARSR